MKHGETILTYNVNNGYWLNTLTQTDKDAAVFTHSGVTFAITARNWYHSTHPKQEGKLKFQKDCGALMCYIKSPKGWIYFRTVGLSGSNHCATPIKEAIDSVKQFAITQEQVADYAALIAAAARGVK